MARVYRGLHESLQREVALKELLPEAKDKESQSRFIREALALAAFRHQNIVTLYDLVEKGDSVFMVMEYVDGPTLAELMRGGPLPPDVAAVIGLQLASALEHAHFEGVIHRDLKPANVMLTRTGVVKLMDFGVAKDEDLEALTREGMAVGTPAYMSPEQVTGTPLDARTDLFSLGVLLYEALSGERPFTGRTAGEVFARVRDARCTPLNRVAPDVPESLVRVVRRALRPSPGQRFPEAAAMGRALDAHVSREVKVSHSALLMAFLRHRGVLTDTDVRAHLSVRELSLVSGFDGSKGRRRGSLKRLGAAAAAIGLGTLAWATHAQWWPLLEQLAR
ncbi:MAG: serine/threonine protein kinase [Myxococcaceae bacterium]|nr:serine/threonine protein kinase [Myxococcaceae bacterium]